MPWDGYNFEDAIVLSERLVKDDIFTSIHIEEFELQVRDTKRGDEEITREIPNVGRGRGRTSTSDGIVRIGAHVQAGRHPGRQGHAEGRDRAVARGEAAHGDLRREGRRREGRVAQGAARAWTASSSTSRSSRRKEKDDDRRSSEQKKIDEAAPLERRRSATASSRSATPELAELLDGQTWHRRSSPRTERRADPAPGTKFTAEFARARSTSTTSRGPQDARSRTTRSTSGSGADASTPPASDGHASTRSSRRRSTRSQPATSCRPAWSSWSRSTSPRSASSRSATRWPAATATRASSRKIAARGGHAVPARRHARSTSCSTRSACRPA